MVTICAVISFLSQRVQRREDNQCPECGGEGQSQYDGENGIGPDTQVAAWCGTMCKLRICGHARCHLSGDLVGTLY